MKKARRAAFTPGASLSIADMEQEGSKDVFAQQAHQRATAIELNLGKGNMASFTLVVVSPEDIERKTTVFSGNGRLQQALDAFTLRDLIPSIRKNGMTFPAIARQLSDGRYEVLEGSRRRATCLLTGQPYYLYVTTSPLVDHQTAQYLSEIGNTYKQLSQYEQGRIYQQLIDAGHSLAEIARQEGITKPKVCQARDAYLLPEVFYQAHASRFDLGRPRINAYRSMLQQATELGVEQDLLDFVGELDPNNIAATIDVSVLGLKKAVRQAEAAIAENEQRALTPDHFTPALACQNVAELMQLPEMVEDLGIAEKVIRVVDKAAAREISEAFEALMPPPAIQDSGHTVFEGQVAKVIRKSTRHGTQLMFNQVPAEQLHEIEQLIATFLAQQESTPQA